MVVAILSLNPDFEVLPFSWGDFYDDGGILLGREGGDFGLFENAGEGVYTGHYFFTSRGKKALKNASSMVEEMLSTATAIRGLVPVKNKAAIWMTRQLGFKSYGVIETFTGPQELFIKMKDK